MDDMTQQVKKYVNQLSSKERKVLEIAQEHLGSSFDILKSNGYLAWVKNKKNK